MSGEGGRYLGIPQKSARRLNRTTHPTGEEGEQREKIGGRRFAPMSDHDPRNE